jgi:CRP-like cAMP-binding protein
MPVQPFSNRLLQTLDVAAVNKLWPFLTKVTLTSREVLESPGDTVKYVYFLESGVVSTVVQSHGKAAEAGLTGLEGVFGTSLLLGDGVASNLGIVQLSGDAYRIGAGDFLSFLDEHPDFAKLCRMYVNTFLIQTAQTNLAMRAKLEERLARWLLMVHDRAGGPRLELTHQFMSLMLATRRAGVTVALHELESQALVKSTRGVVTIIDRKGLEELAGLYYGVAEAEYRRIMRTND